jgi:heat shock protein HtpX
MLDPRVRRRQYVHNALRRVLLLGCLVGVAVGLTFLLLGSVGLQWALVLGAVVLLLQPRVPTRAVLTVVRAQPLPHAVAPELNWMVDELAERGGLHSRPALFYVPSPVPNSFSVGHGSAAALAVTDGILRRLTRREMAGVLAHEISHLRAGDTAVMNLTDVISRLVQGLALLGLTVTPFALALALGGDLRLLALCAVVVALPMVVTLLQLALSRSREFDADLTAALLTGDPEGLARALEVLDATNGRLWERILVSRGRLPDPLLLRTHPSTEERTRRLRELRPGVSDRWYVVGRATPPVGYPQVLGQPRRRATGLRW